VGSASFVCAGESVRVGYRMVDEGVNAVPAGALRKDSDATWSATGNGAGHTAPKGMDDIEAVSAGRDGEPSIMGGDGSTPGSIAKSTFPDKGDATVDEEEVEDPSLGGKGYSKREPESKGVPIMDVGEWNLMEESLVPSDACKVSCLRLAD
jgi:hypothetical protein